MSALCLPTGTKAEINETGYTGVNDRVVEAAAAHSRVVPAHGPPPAAEGRLDVEP